MVCFSFSYFGIFLLKKVNQHSLKMKFLLFRTKKATKHENPWNRLKTRFFNVFFYKIFLKNDWKKVLKTISLALSLISKKSKCFVAFFFWQSRNFIIRRPWLTFLCKNFQKNVKWKADLFPLFALFFLKKHFKNGILGILDV